MVPVEDSVYGNYFKVSLYDELRGAFSTEVHALTLRVSRIRCSRVSRVG